MDTIAFRVEELEGCGQVAEILINAVPLSKLAEDFEFPRYKLASGYVGLPLHDVAPPAPHFRGAVAPHYDYDGRIQLLGCGCGVPGCWPLVCRVEAGEHLVTWSDFCQPFRGPESAGGHWTYDGFGPFVFARRQYEEALENLRAGRLAVPPRP